MALLGTRTLQRALGACRWITTLNSRYTQLRESKAKEISELAEVKQMSIFEEQLRQGTCPAPASLHTLESVQMPATDCLDVLTAAFATFSLHVESRIASLLGEGFYTIGPCGEELLSSIGLVLRASDPMALHYRHVGAQIARQLRSGRPLDAILLDRARGYVVSSLDPVTGGAHCAIGGGKHDYLVTSTLASQTTPAVGRALGVGLAHHLGVDCPSPRDAVSFVSLGDGSVNNGHFLSGINLACYAAFQGMRCPIVFAISNNDLCISLKGKGYLTRDFIKGLRMPVVTASGTDMLDVYRATTEAVQRARAGARPVALVLDSLPRRFGHAATDRQGAYLTPAEIAQAANNNPITGACAQAVAAGVTTYAQLSKMLGNIREATLQAFSAASAEPKLTSRSDLNARVSQPIVGPPAEQLVLPGYQPATAVGGAVAPTLNVMRKNMNGVMDELLRAHRQTVYLSEDGVHGGYYLVTEGLAAKHGPRVRDFPPDETSLMGAAVGCSQMGLVPIVEMPYAKYLDCGADMFYEAVLANWFSNGKQPNGMIVRLQGFDRGVFGGNFHTHNMLTLPPGLDVVCYSNGLDYVRGWRYAFAQAQAGRVVMSVDSTHLLNLRHMLDGDDSWRRPYPAAGEVMTFEQVVKYGDGNRLVIVTYGNGVVTSLRARHTLQQQHGISGITVIDSPYLSRPSAGLCEALQGCSHVLFVDVCKNGHHPLAGIITRLQALGCLPPQWLCVAAQPTYNPLGTTLTFTSEQDVVDGCQTLLARG